MAEEYDEAQMAEDGGMTAPGAPTPLSALEVCLNERRMIANSGSADPANDGGIRELLV